MNEISITSILRKNHCCQELRTIYWKYRNSYNNIYKDYEDYLSLKILHYNSIRRERISYFGKNHIWKEMVRKTRSKGYVKVACEQVM